MSEKLTKTALKNELTRRIDRFESMYQFGAGKPWLTPTPENSHLYVMYGRYCALKEMRWQIKNGLFIHGFSL